jgi:hypothetical protein
MNLLPEEIEYRRRELNKWVVIGSSSELECKFVKLRALAGTYFSEFECSKLTRKDEKIDQLSNMILGQLSDVLDSFKEFVNLVTQFNYDHEPTVRVIAFEVIERISRIGEILDLKQYSDDLLLRHLKKIIYIADLALQSSIVQFDDLIIHNPWAHCEEIGILVD